MTGAVTLFYRQLATLLGAAVPVNEALAALLKLPQPRPLRESLTAVRTSLVQGDSLDLAMAACPRHFNGFAVAMVAAGSGRATSS